MGDTTTATRRLWQNIDRHLLCRAFGLCDPDDDGRCVDCGQATNDGRPVCPRRPARWVP
jgi:hypothetical protein